jgi:phosphohistidine swiveling domain-containing protein
MNLDNFKKHSDWVKVWSGKWSLHTCSQFGGEWTEENKVSNDSAYGLVVYVSRKGISDCWVSEVEKKDLGRRLIAQIKADPRVVKAMSDSLKSRARSVFSFIKKNSGKKVGLEIYNGFWKEISDYYLPHLSVKYIVDYLSPEDLKKYLPVLEEARLYSEPIFREEENFMEKIAEQVAVETDVSKELVLSTTKEELRAYFAGGKLLSRAILEKRFSEAIQFFKAGESKLFSGAEAREMEKIVLPKTEKDLKGQIAYKGKCTGTVRIVWNPSDPSVIFEKGDILVTGMTRPEFLALMKKAGAFVTDAGGILSHAAIVARELKKPCIIGTKIATKVLKDGDEVEVDADKGVVKIIKRT